MTTVAPEDKPTKKLTIRFVKFPVEPTAAKAEVPTYCPTIIVSTVLYNC